LSTGAGEFAAEFAAVFGAFLLLSLAGTTENNFGIDAVLEDGEITVASPDDSPAAAVAAAVDAVIVAAGTGGVSRGCGELCWESRDWTGTT